MTVQELIRALSVLPQDLSVVLEGCDCANLSKGVEVEQFGPYRDHDPRQYVLITCDIGAEW